MRLFVDTANIEETRKANEMGIAKFQKDYRKVFGE